MKWTRLSQNVTVDAPSLAKLIGVISFAEFDQALLETLNEIAPVKEVTGVVLHRDAPPILGGWSGSRADAAHRSTHYANEGYLHDPVLRRLPSRPKQGQIYVQATRVGAIDDEAFRWTYFEDPGYRLCLSYLLRTGHSWNMFRFALEDDGLSKDTIQALSDLTVLLFPIARQHALVDERTTSAASRPMALERLKSVVAGRFQTLTEREIDVCARTALGQNSLQIAEALGVGQSTVLTYRRRAYKRLGISSVGEIMKEIV